MEEVVQWQRRPLERFYPVVFLDAIPVKIREQNRVQNRAAHIAVGVDLEDIKHILGIWIQTHEGAEFWTRVCAELANRDGQDVLIVACDGLIGFPEAIEATWPEALVQTCVVHLIRSSKRYCLLQRPQEGRCQPARHLHGCQVPGLVGGFFSWFSMQLRILLWTG